MNRSRLRQFGFALCAIVSLLASSAALFCACPHHRQTEAEAQAQAPACHEQAAAEFESGQAAAGVSSEKKGRPVASEAGCVCFQPAPKVFAKSDSLRLEKTVAVLPTIKAWEIIAAAPDVAERSAPSKPAYLSDSFYNLTPGRAPPRS